jgi:hypothetical protein
MNIQHSSGSDEWYTPAEYVEAAREVLGTISLDPASCERANETVGATVWYGREDNSLGRDWHGSVFLNPPGGKTGNISNTGLFWTKLMRELELGHIDHAIFMGFSLECLASTQKPGQFSVGAFPICIPAKRIRFVHPMDVKTAPSHSNVIAYIHGRTDYTYRFLQVFEKFGLTRL